MKEKYDRGTNSQRVLNARRKIKINNITKIKKPNKLG